MWTGEDWNRYAPAPTPPAPAPPARSGAAIAYDAGSGRVVLFGGRGDTGGQRVPLGDTWLWNGEDLSWEEIEPDPAPPARTEASAASDEAQRNVVLFGGSGGTELGDTWIFHTACRPSRRRPPPRVAGRGSPTRSRRRPSPA